MIKSFKDFDEELKGQKIYEAFDDKEKKIFTSKDIKTPKLISDNNYFLKISRILLKRLDKCGLGDFYIHPTIVNIDGVDGVHFYNYTNPPINIVICRNVNGKHAYLFKNEDFNLDGKNVADLVLTTANLGFNDIINELINYIKPVTIEESLWSENLGSLQEYTDEDVADMENLPQKVRQNIINLILNTENKRFSNFHKKVWDGYINGKPEIVEICQEIQDKSRKANTKSGTKKDISKEGYLKIILSLFFNAVTQNTAHLSDLKKLTQDCNTNGDNTQQPQQNDNINYNENVNANITIEENKYVRDPYLQKQIDLSAEKYKHDLDDLIDYTTVMCRYVKNHGDLTEDENSIFMKGMIVTGPGGTGKSKHINDILEKENMTKNVDYFELGSGNTSAQNLYRLLYDFNGKLLILDDSADMFEGKYNLPLWKLALDPDPRNNYISYNRSTAVGNFYDPNKKDTRTGQPPTRQQRYFMEVGTSSLEEKTKFEAKMSKDLWSKEDKYSMDDNERTNKELEIKRKIRDAWTEHEENKEPLIPTTFKYNGVVIIISNADRKELIEEIGRKHWDAIKDRVKNIDFDPMPQAIWENIKQKLLEQRDTDPAVLTDKQCIIPRQYVDEVIEEVEKIIDTRRYNRMSWRILTIDLHKAFQGPTGLKRWKNILKEKMDTTI